MSFPRVIAAVFALALALTGCGAPEDAASSPKPAATPTAITQDAFVSTISEAVRASGSSHLTASLAVLGQQLEVDGDVVAGQTPAEVKVAASFTVADIDIRTRLIGDVAYANIGEATDGKFATIDLSDEANPFGTQFGAIRDQVDVPRLLESIESAVSSFESTGAPEDIDGVQAQPYVVTVDTARIDAGPRVSTATLPDEVTYTIYVGPDDLPRRVVIDRDTAEDTVDFTRWGEPVDIVAPAADEKTDVDLLKLFAGLLGVA